MRTVVALLALDIALIGLLLCAGEVVLRMRSVECRQVRPGPVHGPAAAWADSDAELGWTYRHTAPDANPQGFRDTRPFNEPAGRSGSTRVMVLGDSFMWGAGVPASESVPALLEQALPAGHQVFNVAAPGWGIDQMYLAYRRYRDVLHPHVVVLAFIDDDVNRVIEAYRPAENLDKPTFTLADGALLLRTPAAPVRQNTAERLVARSVLLRCATRQVARMTTARAITAQLFRALAVETEGRAERLVVVRIPTRGEQGLLGRLVWRLHGWGSALSETGATYLELLDDMAAADLYGIVGTIVSSLADLPH